MATSRGGLEGLLRAVVGCRLLLNYCSKACLLKRHLSLNTVQCGNLQKARGSCERVLLVYTVCSAGKDARLKGFEFPKGVHLDAEAFSIDHDLITPKMSLKRPQLLKYYKKQVCMIDRSSYCWAHLASLAEEPLLSFPDSISIAAAYVRSPAP